RFSDANRCPFGCSSYSITDCLLLARDNRKTSLVALARPKKALSKSSFRRSLGK
ncbi:unnamed protein product, partial [Arabidopsis halleri]